MTTVQKYILRREGGLSLSQRQRGLACRRGEVGEEQRRDVGRVSPLAQTVKELPVQLSSVRSIPL